MASIAKFSLSSCTSSTNSTMSTIGSQPASHRQVNALNGSNSFDGALADNHNNSKSNDAITKQSTEIKGDNDMDNNLKSKMPDQSQFFVILQRPLEETPIGQMKIALSKELAEKVTQEQGEKTIKSDDSPFFMGQFSIHSVENQNDTLNLTNNDINISPNKINVNNDDSSSNNKLNILNQQVKNLRELNQQRLESLSPIDGTISSYKVIQNQNATNKNFNTEILSSLANQNKLNKPTIYTNSQSNINKILPKDIVENMIKQSIKDNSENTTNNQNSNNSNNSYSSTLYQEQLNNLNFNNHLTADNSSQSLNSTVHSELDNITSNIFDAKFQLNNLQRNATVNENINHINVEFNSRVFGNIKLQLVENNNALQITLVVSNKVSMQQLNNNRRQITENLKTKGFNDIEITVKDAQKDKSKQNNKQTI